VRWSARSRGTEGARAAFEEARRRGVGQGKHTSIDALSSALACAQARKAENEEESRFEEEPVRGWFVLEMIENFPNHLGVALRIKLAQRFLRAARCLGSHLGLIGGCIVICRTRVQLVTVFFFSVCATSRNRRQSNEYYVFGALGSG
jgi:hypothetical protein